MKKINKVFAKIIVGMVGVGYCNLSFAFNWQVMPFLQAQTVFSDNINHESSDDQASAFVTALNPGVSIFRQSHNSLLRLNYIMQTLYNARGGGDINIFNLDPAPPAIAGGGGGDISIFNQLQANGNLIPMPNHFFINARASYSQQNLDNARIANDNIAGFGGRTNVGTFGITPTWRNRFGNYANALIQFDFDSISSGADQDTFSDSINLGKRIFLHSGPEFHRVSWELSFSDFDNFRTSGAENNVSFQNSNAIIRTFLNRQFNVFAQGGHHNNNFQTTDDLNDGFAYTLGAQWQPSNYYGITAGYGNNRFVTVNLSPNQRLNWVVTFRDNDIGLNPGRTWQTFLNYRTPKTNWTFRHDNDTTTTQTILLQQQWVTVDIDPDPLVNRPVQLLFIIPTLTDEVIERKLSNLSFSYFTGKSQFGVNGFLEDRNFQQSRDSETVIGINGIWSWQFAPRTNAFFSPGWQSINRDSPSTTDNRYDIAIGMNRMITNRLTGSLEYRHLNQSSDEPVNAFQENRATASLFLSF